MGRPRKAVVLDKTDTPAMFSKIARRYDLLNHLLSLNIDRLWRRELIRMAELPAGGRVLDACTGTGDVAIGFAVHAEPSDVCGVDLSVEMMNIGRKKATGQGLDGKILFVESDVLELPFADGRFDVVSVAWGLRNLPDYRAGVSEMTRVLGTGGRLLILEFAPPSRDLYPVGYGFYLRRVIPIVGSIVSGSREAYAYLASSVNDFLPKERVLELMRMAGLKNRVAKKLTGGIAYAYRGEK